jgi:thiol-disulfide isomerase/thioredoxin
MNMLILIALAAGAAPDRMAEVDRQQQLIWASSAKPTAEAARAPALAALRRIGTTDDAAGMRAQALLLKWGSARDAQAAWQWLVTRHRDDKRLAPVVEGWWDGSALPDATGQLQRLAAQTRATEVRASARLMLARRDLAEGRRAQGLAALRTLSRTAGATTSSLMGAGDPPRLANVARAMLFQEEALSPGAPLPAITAPTIDGRKPNPADWRGRPVVVDFWATWCPPCIAGLPRLKALATANPQLRLVSVSGDDSPKTVQNWLQRKPHPGVQLWIGPSGRVSPEWVNSAYPFYVVVNRDGRIVGTATGVAEVEKLVAKAVG